MTCFLGVDIGTTSTIGILIRLPDQVLATVSRPVTFSAPHAGWAEEDPEEWWDNVCTIVPELLTRAGVDASDIAGIGVTGMLPAIILLDQAGQLLRPSIQQSDGRCSAEVDDFAADIDEAEFIAMAGNGINQQLVGCKLRWIEKHEAEVFAKIATVFGSYDYINHRLTGKRAIENNWALEGGFVDIATDALSERLIELAHIPRAALPPIIASHQILGHVTAEAAAATGLPEGVPVTGGAADLIASALSAGLAEPGDVLLKFGGSADILIATDSAVPDPRMYLDYHLIPGLYVPNGCMASGGSALNWFVDKIAYGEKESAEQAGLTIHQHLDRLAETTPPGADGVQVIPYFLGEKTPIHDPLARGVISGLSFNHGLPHVWRALLESFGHAFRHHVEVLNDMGHTTTRYLASDGGSNSRLWVQIVSDILQQPIQLLKGHPGSCLGAAWTAAIAAGATDDWHGAARFVTNGDTIVPNPDLAHLYDARYHAYRETYRRLMGAQMVDGQ
ncbi:MAG: FGGY-family carbohydrate kinase [Alphaproteobacteria bacterium]